MKKIPLDELSKTIWLVTVGEPLPLDGRNPRLFRTGLIADELVKKGHKIIWWTSSYDHWAKVHRTQNDEVIKINEYYRIRIIKSLGYKKNISLSRILDHFFLGRKFKKLIQCEEKPDLILCSYPTLELSKVSVSYGVKNKIPVIIDIRDLWPDIFIRIFPKYLKLVGNFLLLPYEFMANYACRAAYGIIGNAPYFVKWGLNRANRFNTSRDCYFPFGYKKIKLLETEKQLISNKLKQKGVELSTGVNILYIGSINHQHDFQSVIRAAKIFQKNNIDVKFIFCGLGDNFKSLKDQSKDLNNVILLGWVDAYEISYLMEKSHIGIAPYITHIGFENNIPNKIIEYLSGGLAIVTTLNISKTSYNKSMNGCCISYSSDNSSALYDSLNYLVSHPNELVNMRLCANKIFQNQYQAEVVYAKMVNYIECAINCYIKDKI